MGVYDLCDISRKTTVNIHYILFKQFREFMMRWNMFLDKIQKIFPILVVIFLLYVGLNQMTLLFPCFLLLGVFLFAWYLSLCLYPDWCKMSLQGVTEPLKISSEQDNGENRDQLESGSCLMINGGWLDSMFMYFISSFSFWEEGQVEF